MEIEAVKEKILSIIDANNGRMLFEALRDALDYRERQFMIQALRQLKADGIAQKQNRIVDGKPIFEVFRIGAPIPNSGS